MNFEKSTSFSNEFKQFSKKWRSLPYDLTHAQGLIYRLYVPKPGVDFEVYRNNFFNGKQATILQQSETVEIVKMRIDSDNPTVKKLLRLIFAYEMNTQTVTFVELYAKNDKEREDPKRFQPYL
jgi:hypothetical protein